MGIRSRTSKFAHVIERVGLAMAGASCGLFVAAHVARASIAVLTSVGAIFAIMICGAIGFYLGIDIPPPGSETPQTTLADHGRKMDPDPVELLSAAGTFLAAMAALVSVYNIVTDAEPYVTWTIVVGSWWLLGVMMQIVAGAIARARA